MLYTPIHSRSDYAALMKLVRIGDRLELQREGYCHWAIFVGDQFVELDDQVDTSKTLFLLMKVLGHFSEG